MATYTQQQLGISTPSGGFQVGGWYGGRQYWNGTFSEAGQIHPESNQQGAGQSVSQEVVAQTNPANVSYLQKQGATPTVSTSAVTPTTATVPTVGASINLPEIYNSLYKSSGVTALEEKYNQMTQAYNEAQSKINDNPYLSEASRVGRIQKLTTDYNNSVSSIQEQIASKKADIETQLNLQTKQYDIESTAYQNTLSQFNTLLELGALNNATDADIAGFSASTGLSSSLIKSAISANKAKNIQTTIQSFDDGTNQGFKIISIDEYGNIVKSQTEIVGKSTKTTTPISLGGSNSDWEIYNGGATGNTNPDISAGWNVVFNTNSVGVGGD
jgi:hypothetical protein